MMRAPLHILHRLLRTWTFFIYFHQSARIWSMKQKTDFTSYLPFEWFRCVFTVLQLFPSPMHCQSTRWELKKKRPTEVAVFTTKARFFWQISTGLALAVHKYLYVNANKSLFRCCVFRHLFSFNFLIVDFSEIKCTENKKYLCKFLKLKWFSMQCLSIHFVFVC